jgi:hypothetical protein
VANWKKLIDLEIERRRCLSLPQPPAEDSKVKFRLMIPKILAPPLQPIVQIEILDEATAHDPISTVESSFNTGDLVWARVNGYPWWPGMVFTPSLKLD